MNLVPMPDTGRPPFMFQWTEEHRRKLERRRAEREAQRLAPDGGSNTNDERRQKTDRRQTQICFVCRSSFEPTSPGQTICSSCRLDGIRGGSGWPGKKF
jgi:hypothetical protein